MLRALLLSMAVTGQTAPPPRPGTAPRPDPNVVVEAIRAFKNGNANDNADVPRSRVILSDLQNGLGGGRSLRLLASNRHEDSELALVAPDDALRAQLKLPGDRGLVVASAPPRSSAWRAGVREGDVLSTLDGAPLGRPDDLDRKLREAGERPLTLELIRKGAPVKLTVQARTWVALGPVDSEQSAYVIGVAVTPVGPVLRSQLGLPDHQGLIVTKVEDDSPAARAEIKVNDVILAVAGQPQTNQEALADQVQKSEGKSLAIEIVREGERRSVQATPEKGKASRPFSFAYIEGRPVVSVGRPGVVQGSSATTYADTPFNITFIPNGTPGDAARTFTPSPNAVVVQPHAPNASTERLDAMAAEVKELRRAVDELRTALERKN